MTDKKEEIIKKYKWETDSGWTVLNDSDAEKAMDEYYNQAIEDALAEVEKYDTGKELSPLVKTLITKLKALKK